VRGAAWRGRATSGGLGFGALAFAKQGIAEVCGNGDGPVQGAHPTLPAARAVVHVDAEKGFPRCLGAGLHVPFRLFFEIAFPQQKNDIAGGDLLARLGSHLQPHLFQKLMLHHVQTQPHVHVRDREAVPSFAAWPSRLGGADQPFEFEK